MGLKLKTSSKPPKISNLTKKNIQISSKKPLNSFKFQNAPKQHKIVPKFFLIKIKKKKIFSKNLTKISPKKPPKSAKNRHVRKAIKIIANLVSTKLKKKFFFFGTW